MKCELKKHISHPSPLTPYLLKSVLVLMAVMLATASCTTHYTVSSVERTRLLIDKRYDRPMTDEVSTFMKPFKAKVDSLMSPVLGRAAQPLQAYRPESPLSNLLPDVLVWAGKLYNEKPDFGVYNMGGIRASFAKGNITIGDVFEVAPFENKICFITLSGEKVLELLGQICFRKGEGISHEVRITATPEGKLIQATIGGKEIDPSAQYRIATIDYVSHGNDRMTAFKSGTDRRELTSDDDLLRAVIMKYIKEKTANGQEVDCQIEGRYIVEE